MPAPNAVVDFDERAFRGLFIDRKSLTQLAGELDCSPARLDRYRKELFAVLMQDYRKELMADKLLGSLDRTIMEFEDLNSQTKELAKQFSDDKQWFSKLAVLREWRFQLETVLKRLGEFKTGFQEVKVDKAIFVNSNEFVVALKDMQERWFEDMDADYDGQRLIFRSPKPEVLERYHKWKAKKRLKNAIPGQVIG
jgi:hypothetical protein